MRLPCCLGCLTYMCIPHNNFRIHEPILSTAYLKKIRPISNTNIEASKIIAIITLILLEYLN
jgi:hypothetical protein